MRKPLWIVGGVVLAAAIVLAAVTWYCWQLPRVRGQIESILSAELGGRVELANLSIAFGPRVRVFGGGLVLHHQHHPDLPPLVRIEGFVIEASPFTVWRRPYRIERVRVTGLRIFIPPGDDEEERRAGREGAPREQDSGGERGVAQKLGDPARVVIGELISENALLEIGTSKPGREPRRFEIHDVNLRDVRFDRATRFEAHLTNPTPAGTIRATGTFGPWEAVEPSLTAVAGTYRFADADLGTIKGIGGILESRGEFSGRLERIHVKGSTTTPAFSLDIGGAPVSLETVFSAIVDGTNGDTLLNPVAATLGETPIRATGGVLHTDGRQGRVIILDVAIDEGRLQDVLRLALKESPPPMSGALTLTTNLEIPPGEKPVPEKLELDGEFSVTALRFASNPLQEKIDDFSRRARGTPRAAGVKDVPSAMRGTFRLRNGTLGFSGLSYAMRGALVRLDGHYVLASKAIDFRGTVRLDARLSETMKTGWKALLLKLVDPIFAKDGAGAVIPVRITGTASAPDVGLDVGKVF